MVVGGGFDAQHPRKKIRHEAEAQDLLDQFKGYSGTLREFCAEMDVDGRSLRAWQRRLTPEMPPPPLKLVELPGALLAATARYRLTVGDVLIEVNDDFNPQVLATLLQVVRSFKSANPGYGLLRMGTCKFAQLVYSARGEKGLR